MDTQQVAHALLTASDYFAFSFERNFKLQPFVKFAQSHVAFPVCVLCVYVAFCFLGARVMANRKAMDLRLPLAIWNATLCAFSFVGMCRTMPRLVANILLMDYEATICGDPTNPPVGGGSDGGVFPEGTEGWANGVCGFWVMLFIFSKIPELGDTVFIVLRKKPLIFLHWYHHVTVLLFCWNSYATMSGSGLYFVSMHFTVHTLMYGYYCLLALNLCPKSFPSFIITFAQIGQMFIGTFICASAWYYKYASSRFFSLRGLVSLVVSAVPFASKFVTLESADLTAATAHPVCHNSLSNLTAGALMFGCYIYLFVDFSLRRSAHQAHANGYANTVVGAHRRRVLKSVKTI